MEISISIGFGFSDFVHLFSLRKILEQKKCCLCVYMTFVITVTEKIKQTQIFHHDDEDQSGRSLYLFYFFFCQQDAMINNIVKFET